MDTESFWCKRTLTHMNHSFDPLSTEYGKVLVKHPLAQA